MAVRIFQLDAQRMNIAGEQLAKVGALASSGTVMLKKKPTTVTIMNPRWIGLDE